MKAKKNWGIDSTKERVNKNTDGGRSFLRIAAVSAAILATALVIGECRALAQDNIESYVKCLKKAQPADIAGSADKCIPQGCKITVTMSNRSAQEACIVETTVGTEIRKTQLPRIVLSCPGPAGNTGLRLRPSWTLCRNQGRGDTFKDAGLGQDAVFPGGPFAGGNVSFQALIDWKTYDPIEALDRNDGARGFQCWDVITALVKSLSNSTTPTLLCRALNPSIHSLAKAT